MSPEPHRPQSHGSAEALAIESLDIFLRDAGTEGLVGVVTLSIQPDTRLLRLDPEALKALYGACHDLLRDSLRSKDRVLRTNAFEWTIVLPELPSPAALTLAMLRIVRTFERPPPVLLRISTEFEVYCGGALHPETSGDARHLLQSARIACLDAQKNRERYAQYQPEMETQAKEKSLLLQEVSGALSAGGFELYLQPQVHLGSGQCIGAEALLRWQRANGEWVPPPTLLSAIEFGGLRPTFNRWLFHRTMQIAQSLSFNAIEVPLSINLSPDDLLDRDLPMLLEQAMRTFGVSPSRIRLEITENALVNHTESARALIDDLLKLGVSLSIDDFGTGYSGMTHLRTVPAQEIKIDQMFIFSLAESAVDQKIVRAILDLGKHLEIGVLAEGVETVEAARILHNMGCEAAQGYLYGRPMPLSDFVSWMRART